MRITKVYTRAGDRGRTRLVGGPEVGKDDPRIESYGTVDELNAIVGLVRIALRGSATSEDARAKIDGQLDEIQHELFDVGSDLATRPGDRWATMVRLGEPSIQRLEDEMDALNLDLPPLEEFVLPGGGPAGAFLHQARTVCRRAEREIVRLIRVEPDADQDAVLRYVNRLSDWFFVAGRWAALQAGEPETLWRNPNKRPKRS